MMSNSFDIVKNDHIKIYDELKCPYCNAKIVHIPGDTCVEIITSPYKCYQKVPSIGAAPMFSVEPHYNKTAEKKKTYSLKIKYIKCPYCEKISASVLDLDNDKQFSIFPASNAMIFPDTVPQNIYKDYYEACLILDASPTASATLSRRCLQSMVRERWNIDRSELNKEIDKIPQQNISGLERDALHAVRKIGNIGAHPDMILEVSRSDAELTLRIIELFLKKWYIDEPANQSLLNEAIEVAEHNDELKSNA